MALETVVSRSNDLFLSPLSLSSTSPKIIRGTAWDNVRDSWRVATYLPKCIENYQSRKAKISYNLERWQYVRKETTLKSKHGIIIGAVHSRYRRTTVVVQFYPKLNILYPNFLEPVKVLLALVWCGFEASFILFLVIKE